MLLWVPLLLPRNAAWTLQCRISIALGMPLCCNGVFAAHAATLWERDTMNRITAAVAGLSLALVGTSASFAATINVPGDQPTILAAISASVNGDMINIAAGTYNEYNLNPGGKAITIQGILNGDGSLATTIDGQQGGSVFTINGGEGAETVIQNLMITGGSSNYGGGIVVRNSSPTISGCTISGNMADESGGGIFCDGSNPTISDCTIEGNTTNGLRRRDLVQLQQPHHQRLHDRGQHRRTDRRRRDLLQLQQPHHQRLHDRGQHRRRRRRRDLLQQQQQPHHQRLHDRGQHSRKWRRDRLHHQQPHHQWLHDRGQLSRLWRRDQLLNQQQPHHQRLYLYKQLTRHDYRQLHHG